MKRLIFCGMLLLAVAGCSDKKEVSRPHSQMEYDGLVVCPRCKKYLDQTVFEQPGQLIGCPECKGKAPRGAYCYDLKKQ